VSTMSLPFDVLELRAARACGNAERDLIARHVLAFTALFAGRDDVAEQAATGTLDTSGTAPHLHTEQLVRDLGPAAERSTAQVTGRHPRTGDVLFAVLDDEHLLDDYQRIVAGKQHAAFADPVTDLEIDAQRARARALQAEAAQTHQDMDRWRKHDARLCRCGRAYRAHRRPETHWQLSSVAAGHGCWSFRHIEDAPCRAVPGELVRPALDAWALREEQDLDEVTRAQIVLLVSELSRGAGTTLLGLAFPAMVAAVRRQH
jgi:hypothetical protein